LPHLLEIERLPLAVSGRLQQLAGSQPKVMRKVELIGTQNFLQSEK